MRRLALVAAALVVPVLPVLAAAPAHAVDNVICVNNPGGACDQSVATIPLAITAAASNAVDDLIRVAPGTYSDGPYQLIGTSHGVTMEGAGQGDTIIDLPASGSPQAYVSLTQATVRSLTITMTAAQSAGDRGLSLSGGSAADHVSVDGSGTADARGVVMKASVLTDSAVQMPSSFASGSTGIYGQGAGEITGTDISGATGFLHSDALPDSLSRVTITAEGDGVITDYGTVEIDDAVIDLGAGTGTGLNAANYGNSPFDKAINANHVTVVGGAAGSVGVWAFAAAAGAKQTTTIQLDNSIVTGPGVDLLAQAANDGSQGGNSTATITTTYSDWATSQEVAGANGTAEVVVGAGHLDVVPAFADAAGGDYRLTPGSPVVDKGDPAGGPATDRDGAARVRDGDGVPGAVRDMGAYELPDSTAPDTTITSGPAGLTSDATPTFAFTSEPGATFECKLDAGAFAACASPFTTPSLAGGAHALAVRAKDAASNLDATPATRAFSVDIEAPDTTITTKPARRITKRKVKLAFSSEVGATFQCQVDGKAWQACTSPVRLKVKVGKHVVLVRATDAVGNTDATPAKIKFRRVPKTR